MGLTREAVGRQASGQKREIHRQGAKERVVALAGNPNVGKSTVFNGLTGLHQHTGNWTGKTVANAQGICHLDGQSYRLVDVPGCYSLQAHSPEEELARDFICFGQPDAVVVVCDATCLERSLNLAVQIMEAAPRVVICVNLLDEAKKKGLQVDLEGLSQRLGAPVVGAAARSGKGLSQLLQAVETECRRTDAAPRPVSYPEAVEAMLEKLLPEAEALCPPGLSPRWLCARLLEGQEALQNRLLPSDPLSREPSQASSQEPSQEAAARLESLLQRVREERAAAGWSSVQVQDAVAEAFVRQAETLCRGIVRGPADYRRRDRKLDALFTSRLTGFPIMLLLLCGIF